MGRAKYNFTDALSLRVEYENFGEVGNEQKFDSSGRPIGTGRATVSLVSAGIDFIWDALPGMTSSTASPS